MAHVKYLETDTSRLKEEIMWAESGTGDMFECVHVDFAREQEAEIERLRARPSVDDLAKIIDPEAFGLPDNVGDESDRDAARSRARLVLNALEQKADGGDK